MSDVPRDNSLRAVELETLTRGDIEFRIAPKGTTYWVDELLKKEKLDGIRKQTGEGADT